jgi:eukaryotic-like serine/threonine-protein kinase
MATPPAVGLPVIAGRWEYDTRVVFAAGNNAQTYAGRDLRTEEEVVVKIFSHAADGRGRERFQREARLHEELKHEAILELVGRGSDDGVDYMVTRRLRPGALWDVVRDRSQLSPAATLRIGIRMADALAFMHGRNEVHGDISPGNILLDKAEDAYLADFGFSKRIATVAVATTGDSFGTPGFSLPREPDSQRTFEDDVYGLAAVLWFCLTGKPPAASARARRREIPSRALRAPLNQALRWESESIPTAEAFKDSLARHWSKVGKDWRVVSAPPRRSRLPLAAAAGLVALLSAGLAGQALQPKPADAAQTTVDRAGVTLNLNGKWRSRSRAPKLPAFRLRSPVAASRGRATVVAGRAPSAGAGLIAKDALATLPRPARKPEPIVVGDYPALRYGPATTVSGGIQEVLALPLERTVLVVYCSGPEAGLPSLCTQASADLELEDGSPQPLAPTASVTRQLKTAVDRLGAERQKQRALLASTANQQKLSGAAEDLAHAHRAFADKVSALPTTAQDAKSIDGAAGAAREAEAGYADLAEASTESAWNAAQGKIDQGERRLEAAVRQLGRMKVYKR